jgi:MerR family transcriptional regulator, heat shock protein HspR
LSPAHASPSWRRRLDDPRAPLFTIAVVAELLDIDPQVIRRFEAAGLFECARPSGNQRRYSRLDVERLANALELARQGHARLSVVRIIELEGRVSRRR